MRSLPSSSWTPEVRVPLGDDGRRRRNIRGGVLVGVRDDLVQLPGETEIVTLGNADIDDRLTVVGCSFALEKLGDQEEGLGLLVVNEGRLSSGGRSVDLERNQNLKCS